MGTVSTIVPLDTTESGGGGWSITIGDATPVLDDCHIGDSICCNGVCLTVTEFTADTFKVGVAPETLDRSNLGEFDHVTTSNYNLLETSDSMAYRRSQSRV